MVFVPTHDAATTIFEVATSGKVARVEAVIGIDPDIGAIYTITVSFDFGVPLYGAELNFWITERQHGQVTDDFWDGTRTRFIQGADRNSILQWVLIGIEVLITSTMAGCVCMTTKEADLPPRALTKYLKITEVFRNCGFLVTERDPLYGIRSWLFDRGGLG